MFCENQPIVTLKYIKFRALFNSTSTLHDWLTKTTPLFHPIRSKTKAYGESPALVFPRFASATHILTQFES